MRVLFHQRFPTRWFVQRRLHTHNLERIYKCTEFEEHVDAKAINCNFRLNESFDFCTRFASEWKSNDQEDRSFFLLNQSGGFSKCHFYYCDCRFDRVARFKRTPMRRLTNEDKPVLINNHQKQIFGFRVTEFFLQSTFFIFSETEDRGHFSQQSQLQSWKKPSINFCSINRKSEKIATHL